MAHTVESLKNTISKFNLVDMTFTGKEVKALPAILSDKEQLLAVLKGWYKNGTGLLCVTNNRILFVNKGMFSLKVEEFSLKTVSSISTESGVIFGKVKIFASGNNAEIDQANKQDAKQFVDKVRSLIEERDNPAAKPAQKEQPDSEQTQQKAETDIYEQLEKLAGLKEKGIITQQEFDAKKAQLLNL